MDYNTEKYDVIILAGQSNAEGSGIGDVRHKFKNNDKIFILEDKNRPKIKGEVDLLVVGKETDCNIIPAKEYSLETGEKLGNFSLSFAEEYIKQGLLKDGRKLLIVYTAIGGTGFARYQWGNTTVMQERMFKMIDYAMQSNKDNRIVAFLWHQGEHDAFENSELTLKTRELYYYDKFGYLIKTVKEKYGKDFPIIAGAFSTEWVQSGYEKQCAAIYKATKRVLKENGGAFVNSNNLLSNNQTVHNGDNIHFSRQSLYYLGKRYFKAYKKLKNIQ